MEIPKDLRILVRHGTTYHAKQVDMGCTGCAFLDETYRLLVDVSCAKIECAVVREGQLVNLIYVEEPDGNTGAPQNTG